MAVFESNAEWLPYMLESCDRLFKLYASERGSTGDRLPSEAFHEQCVISFESDETGVFRQWERLSRTIGIWASDAYHHDGADSWSAMRNMTECGVPEEVQASCSAATPAASTAIEAKLFVTDEAAADRAARLVPAGCRARRLGGPRGPPAGARGAAA